MKISKFTTNIVYMQKLTKVFSIVKKTIRSALWLVISTNEKKELKKTMLFSTPPLESQLTQT